MKLKKKIAAMGAAVMIMASMSAIGASAYQASYEDSYRIILAYTSYTPSETDSVGTVTNLSTTKTNYSVQSTLYYKTSAAKIGSYTPSGWKKGTVFHKKLYRTRAYNAITDNCYFTHKKSSFLINYILLKSYFTLTLPILS